MDRAWWQRWEAELDGERISESAIAEMRAQPGFHDAMWRSIRGALRLNDDDPALHDLIADSSSMFLGLVALHLDATGGLTHRRLREVAGIEGALSAGRVSALLMRMQMIGYIRAARDHAPGTPKPYRPTPRMIAAFRARYRLDLEAIEAMAPDMADLLSRYDDPESFRTFTGILGACTLRAVRAPRPGKHVLEPVGVNRAGGQVLISLLDAAAEAAGRFPAAGPAPVSISALARRFRVSRTQILRILRQAEAAGLFIRGGKEGEGVVQPLLVETFEALYAESYVGLAASAHRALRGQAAVEAA